jgi:hypothetical protein
MTMRYVHVAPTTLLGTVDTIRRATPIPWKNGTPAVTKPLTALSLDASSPADFRFTQQKTGPVGSAFSWSG